MRKILIINGPNLNLLGKREPSTYGNESFESFFEKLKNNFSKAQLSYFQTNSEGEIIDKLQSADGEFDGIVLNAGGYSHTSVAILDAVRSIQTPVIEVHISNIFARAPYRHHSFISQACKGCIIGFGLNSYNLAIQSFML